MRDELLLYYEQELTHLRQAAMMFAEKYPKVAGRLVLEPDKCEDPHVERLMEAFAFLAARVHLKIDDEYPEITDALLGLIYPHVVRPVPSMSIAEFQLDPEQGKLAEGFHVPVGSTLLSRPVNGVPCRFRTCYDTTLWPVTVASAQFRPPDQLAPPLRALDAPAAIRLELQGMAGMELKELTLDRLRLHLSGDGMLVHTAYELLCTRLLRVVVRDLRPGSRVAPVTLPASALQPVGFAADEGMVPYPHRSFLGYRLLQELFAFPQKFFFLDLSGLRSAFASLGSSAEVIFLLSDYGGEDRRQRLEIGLSGRTFRTGCVPVVNLFQQAAEPILLNQQHYEYPVVPDVRRPGATEVFSVDDVAGLNHRTQQTINFAPFYAYRPMHRQEKEAALWLSHRRPSIRANDDGTEVTLSLVDLTGQPRRPDSDVVHVRVTCTNRDLPARLPFGNEGGDFTMEQHAPLRRIVALVKPTAPVRPAMGHAGHWALVSHLSLNHLSLVSEGREALQHILRLYNSAQAPFAERMIEGIVAVRSVREMARVVSDEGVSFARGVRVEVEFDEEQFVGGGVYLFASVLEQFLGLYATLNSFSQLVASSRQRKEVLRAWPPRAGRQILM